MKKLFEKLSPDLKQRFGKVKLLVLDFDGTLTDNKVYTDQNQKETVMADRGDGLGLEMVRKHGGVDAIILSTETNPVTAARAKKLNIPCVHGLDSKIEVFKAEAKKRGLSKEEICFVGNDVNDIECMGHAGIAVAIEDSYAQTLAVADYVTQRKGGHGAVREVCELILYAKNTHPFP